MPTSKRARRYGQKSVKTSTQPWWTYADDYNNDDLSNQTTLRNVQRLSNDVPMSQFDELPG